MNILLVAATDIEIKPFMTKINRQSTDNGFIENIRIKNISIDILITGVGLVFTSYKLTKALNIKKYDLVINAGIAGSFNRNLPIGDVVIITQEEFGDLGIDEPDGFQTIFEKGFIKNSEFPFKDGILKCTLPEKLKNSKQKPVKGLSSNTAHGNEIKIKQLLNKFNPDIETMEGAAFFYVCLMEKVSFVEIRSISNYVEARDTGKWDIPLAIENLSVKLLKIIGAL